MRNKTEVLVVEEKRGIIESQFKEYFYDYPGDKPKRMVGKESARGQRLVPWVGELSPLELVPIVARRLDRVFAGDFDLMGDEAMCPPLPMDTHRVGMGRYMYSLGLAVAAGTSNIQRNLIGERGLGLPRDSALRKKG